MILIYLIITKTYLNQVKLEFPTYNNFLEIRMRKHTKFCIILLCFIVSELKISNADIRTYFNIKNGSPQQPVAKPFNAKEVVRLITTVDPATCRCANMLLQRKFF